MVVSRLALGFVGLVLFFCAEALAQGKRIALVIGNAAYRETAPLANPRNDATDLAAALRRLSFEVLDGFDLDKRAMERLIRDFDQRLNGAELAVFFFAGHGIQIAGQNHLVPVDARLASEGDVDFESLSLRLVLSRMERKATTSLVLLDACRDNPLARNLARSMGTRSMAIGSGLAEVKTGVGSMISFSTQPGNVALDGQGRNSPYTAALLAQLGLAGRDVMTMMAAVRGDVIKVTQGKQVPWEHTSLLGPVLLHSPDVAASAHDNRAPAPASAEAAAADAWPLVRDTSNVAAIDAYLRRFGETFHGDIARMRLEQLKRQAPGSQILSKGSQGLPPAEAQTGQVCSGASIWSHNGSEMRLVAEGQKRSLYYHAPRTSLAQVGIKEGTLLFDGERKANRYMGTARRFSEKCRIREYEVSGEIVDERRITMRGTVMGVNTATCAASASYEDVLEFAFERCE